MKNGREVKRLPIESGEENNVATIGIVRIAWNLLFLGTRTESSDRFVQRMFQEIVVIRRRTFVGRLNASEKVHALRQMPSRTYV